MTSLVDRSEYAALAEHIYLNQASLGLIPSRSTAAMLLFLSDVAQYGNIRLSDENEAHLLDELRAEAASFIGTDSSLVAILVALAKP